jgi:uncharacterized protein DUF1559
MSRKRWFIIMVAILCLAGCVVFAPCLVIVRDGEGWQESAHRLKQIGLALHLYHDIYGRLPPAVKRGNEGQPLYSWRVHLLPFLEQDHLYKQFNLDETWDSPHNKPLVEKIPKCYMLGIGRSDLAGLTHYQAVVGPGTAFERNDLADSLLLVVEAAHPVPWTEPADVVYSPKKPMPELGGLFQQPIHLWCYEIGRREGFNTCFTDGNVRFISSDTAEHTLHGLIARRDGEKGDTAR